MTELILPIKVFIRYHKKKNKDIYFRLNLNNYRNTNQFTLNTAKKGYNDIVLSLLKDTDLLKEGLTRYEITYQMVLANNRIIDPNNFYGVVDKFFQDALKKAGVIVDDNYLYAGRTIFEPAWKDTSLPDHHIITKIEGYV